MKKKRFLFLLVLCLSALLCFSLAACNPGGNNPDDSNPNEYEESLYTVTFNTDSDFVLSNPVIKNVKWNTKISAPKDADGNLIVPVKTGYTFRCWSSDKTNPFDFNTTTITANTTIYAIYDANEYKHNVVLDAKLAVTKDGDNYKYEVDEDARANDAQKPSLTEGEQDPNTTTLRSKYNLSSSLPIPTLEGSKFCFWYYIDESGKPKQFTKWAGADDKTVSELTKYTFTEPKTLYPMFEDNLPKVTVNYTDPHADSIIASQEYTFGQNVPASNKPTEPTENGYLFDHWYYVVETKAEDGSTVKTNEPFVFEIAEDKDNKPTSPMDAADAKDNFTPVTLTLYAKWTLDKTITSVKDYQAIYDLLRTENPDKTVQAQIEELLSGNLHFSSIDFGSETFEPLFDAEHRFKGVIDGNIGTIDAVDCCELSGGTFGNASGASVFGYVDGNIKNINFSNINLVPVEQDGGFANNLTVGTIANENGGVIENCSVNLNAGNVAALSAKPLHNLVFGGIAAKNKATTSDNSTGKISGCRVKIEGFTVEAEALTFGGIVGENGALSPVERCVAEVLVSSVKCEDDGIAANGAVSALYFGGIAGINGGHISASKVVAFTLQDAQALSQFYFGGVTGHNTGMVETTSAAAGVTAAIGGSSLYPACVGGLVGKNEGNVLNCYTDNANIEVKVNQAPDAPRALYVGGLVGGNFSTKGDMCQIKYSYALGEIKVTVADGIDNVKAYVGGITGYNSHKQLTSLFAGVKINVTNGGENSVGKLIGNLKKDASIDTKCFYADVELKLNETVYVEPAEGEKVPEGILQLGDSALLDNLKDEAWVLGSEGTQSKLGFAATNWEVKDGLNPTLKADPTI